VAELDALLVEPGDAVGVSHHLRRDGELWQLREYVAQRSIYHLKEADPQSFVIARLDGPAKAALVTVEHDEYGAGDPDRMHSRLFADMMVELDLSDAYGAYLDAVPAPALAEVNFMSLCGLHRGLRGTLVGQFATVELTSSPGSDRLVKAMRRLGCGPAAIRFYAEHVEADAVHEQLIRRDVLAPLLAAEPQLAPDVVFGIRASVHLASHLEDLLLGHWRHGESSLRWPIPPATSR
ncbi:MAG: iron-containing redox enzyme family protein, partial [Sciscionella sp.]